MLIFISLVLIFAFIVEYNFGHQPCKLCLYERIPYFFSIFLIAKMLFIKSFQRSFLFILFLTFSASSILAFYHFGIEQGFFNESFICKTGNFSEYLSKEELLEQLKLSTPSCKDVNFNILGFSLAAINTIISVLLSVIFIRLFINYGKN